MCWKRSEGTFQTCFECTLDSFCLLSFMWCTGETRRYLLSLSHRVALRRYGGERVTTWMLRWTPFSREMTVAAKRTHQGNQNHESFIPSELSLSHACELLKSRQLSYSEVGTMREIITRLINSPRPSQNVRVLI